MLGGMAEGTHSGSPWIPLKCILIIEGANEQVWSSYTRNNIWDFYLKMDSVSDKQFYRWAQKCGTRILSRICVQNILRYKSGASFLLPSTLRKSSLQVCCARSENYLLFKLHSSASTWNQVTGFSYGYPWCATSQRRKWKMFVLKVHTKNLAHKSLGNLGGQKPGRAFLHWIKFQFSYHVVQVRRNGFPNRSEFARTVCNVKGQTSNKVIVDICSTFMTPGKLYVDLLRLKKSTDAFIFLKKEQALASSPPSTTCQCLSPIQLWDGEYVWRMGAKVLAPHFKYFRVYTQVEIDYGLS